MEEESELSRLAKQKAKRTAKRLLIKILPVIAGILVLVLVATAVASIFTNIMEKLAELAANVKTRLDSFWKWFTDDYWIKLDKEIEFTEIDEETRSGSSKNQYTSR